MCSKNEYTKSESNSQPVRRIWCLPYDCVQRTNIQNLKAIHNLRDGDSLASFIVFKERIYKIWKQFTTILPTCLRPKNCVQRTNIQNLKAIHNVAGFALIILLIVFKERIYKIWKQFTTQLWSPMAWSHCVQRTNIQNLKAIHNTKAVLMSCDIIVFKERIYKIWKQFTTARCPEEMSLRLCSKNEYTKSESNSQQVNNLKIKADNCVQRTNIQNLKAIHNRLIPFGRPLKLCSKNEYTKSESNSQRRAQSCTQSRDCVQRTNIQNLKAIHNCVNVIIALYPIVFKERIYKIWKQFTTRWACRAAWHGLCSKNEYTKSESNSQRATRGKRSWTHCVQRTNIQNLKAIHNDGTTNNLVTGIVFKERIYKIWKQFTTFSFWLAWTFQLCSKNEYTKSESNSQRWNN